MITELPDLQNTSVVISIETYRASRYVRKLEGKCPHTNVFIDPSLAHVTCKQCNKELNPIEYLCLLAEHWHRVQDMINRYEQMKKYTDSRARVKCRKCGTFTNIV